MMNMMFLTLGLLAILTLVAHQEVNGRASYLECGTSDGWAAGELTNYNTAQHASTYSADGSLCSISVSPNVTAFNAGQTFTITINSGTRMGYKVESTAGTITGPSTGGSAAGARCINWDKGRYSSATMTFTAPASGQAQVRAICSGSRGNVYAATPVTLQAIVPPTEAPVTESPVTTSPTTARPTVANETFSPTVTDSPTPPTISTSTPTLQPTEPTYAYDRNVGGTITISYRTNATHAKFKVAQPFQGFVSIGLGTTMIGSIAIVGMDPALNTANPGVGLYKLVSSTESQNGKIMENLAVSAPQLAQYGIIDTEFTYSSFEGSTMAFTLILANQDPEFTLVKPDQSSFNLVYAAGPSSSNGFFCREGTCYQHEPGAYGSLMVNFLLAPSAWPIIHISPVIPMSQELVIHIITMIIGWGILIPLGIVIPLYNNIKYSPKGRALCGVSGPNWVKYHWVLTVIGVLFTYIGTFYGYKAVGETDHWQSPHEQLGLFLLFASIIQPVYAFLRPRHGIREGFVGLIRKGFDYGHPIFGYITAFLAIYDNLTGISEIERMYGESSFSFIGLVGATGFGGWMGMAVLGISLAFIFLMGLGLMRAIYVRFFYKQNSMQVIESGDDFSKPIRSITINEIEAHTTQSSFWVIYKDKVYDVTNFLNSHPGGKKVMLPFGGKDMTVAYIDVGHSARATAMLKDYYIGDLQQEGRTQSSYRLPFQNANPSQQTLVVSGLVSEPQSRETVQGLPNQVRSNSFLGGDNQVRKQVVLTHKVQISPDTCYLKFAFPGAPNMVLGLPTGKHISIYAPAVQGKVRGKWNGKTDTEGQSGEISRKYTPITCDESEVGFFALIIKMYRPCKQFPDGGRMSQYLEKIQIGESITIAGPFGTHFYVGKGRMLDRGHELHFSECAMIAGGSGITPVLQVATSMLLDSRDATRISVIYANSSVDDILMKDYLDQLALDHPIRFRVWYTISRSSGADWPYSVGRISKKMMQEHLPAASPTSMAMICGPPAMVLSVNTILQNIGYPEDRIVEF